jgi:hypothetical protein
MALSTVQLGRLALKELPQNQAGEQSSALAMSSSGRLLHIVGQEAYPLSTVAQMSALHDDLQGLVAGSYLIPVSFGDKADRNGYYTVYAAQSGLQNWTGEAITDDWAVDLQRVGSQLEVDLESRVTGPQTVSNSFALTGVLWNSPPAGHFGFWSGATAPSAVSRASADGVNQLVWTGLPLQSTYRWGCAVASYGNGRARFLDDNGIERSGIDFSIGNTALWTLSNGLVRVQPGTSGNVLDVSCWSAGAWQVKAWDLLAGATALSSWSSVSVLRNDYEVVIVRLLKDGAPGRTLIDLTLRRGSRFVEIYINAQIAATLKVVRHSAEAGTSATGTVTATANDAAGNRYTVGSAHGFTADTANGGLSLAATTTLDAYVGAVVGGGGAASGDAAADLLAQYAGRRGEYVQAVRR